MRELIQSLPNCQDGTVMVIGAGSGQNLPLLRELGATRLVLVEPDELQADALSRKIHQGRGEEVWVQAICAGPSEPRELHVLNHRGFNSLNSPGKLIDYFPNIRKTNATKVSSCSLADALERLELNSSAGNLLILDAPGQAFELLESAPVETLQKFKSIVVRGSVEPLYAGDKSMTEVLALLGDRGFDLKEKDASEIHPQSTALLVANPLRIECCRLGLLLSEVRIDRDTQKQLALRYADDLAAAKRGRAEATQALTRVKGELEASVSALVKKRDDLTRQSNQYKAELEDLRRQVDVLRGEASKMQGEIDTLSRERDERGELLEKTSALSRKRGARVIELEREQAKLNDYQSWLSDEVVKAESHVELIKDIFLRGKVL